MGEEFNRLGLDYDVALVSPARRAAETFALVREQWADRLQVRSEPRLYHASLGDLLAIVGETPPRVQRLLLVGHNPGLHQLAAHLGGGDSPQRSLLREKLPTGSLVEIALRGDWKAAEAGGELLRFLRPRDLASD